MSVLTRPLAAPSNAQLLELFEQLDQPMLVFDVRQRLSLCNRAAGRLLGSEAGQPGDAALALLTEASRAALLDAAAREDGQATELQVADGRRLGATWQALPGGAWALLLRASQGMAAQADNEIDRELVRLLWPSTMPIALQDGIDFSFVAVNGAFARLLGRSADDLAGVDPLTLAPEEDHAELLAHQRDTAREPLDSALSGEVERRLFDLQGRLHRLRCHWRVIRTDDQRRMLLTLVQDVTLEHQARTQADQSVMELQDWFDLSPVGMLVIDDSGLVLRSNHAFEALAGSTPVSLRDAAPALQALLGWQGDALHDDLRPGAPTVQTRGLLPLPDGRQLRLRARLRACRAAQGGMRVMAVVEDCSVEEERDLAQLEMGALMDTAGVGVATYEPTRGWLRNRGGRGAASGPAALAAISRELVEPGSLPDYDRLQVALREGQRAQVRYAVRHPELGQRWLLTRVEPGELPGGRRTVSVVTLDLTELEGATRRSEELLRERELMFTLSDVGMAYVREGHIERANEALSQLTGYAAAELDQLPLARLFEDEAAFERQFSQERAALGRGGHWGGERRLRRRDGSLRWVQVSKRSVNEADAGAGLICSYVDVDERHRARETLQLQAERTRAILDSVLVGIVTVGERGIEWMNRSARRMFAGELADFIGEPIGIVATEDADHPLRRTHYRQTLADGQAETFECRLRGRDGREFWVVGNAVVTGRSSPELGADGGSAPQITFALLDIERRRQAEVSIAQAQASLQRIIETAPLAIALFEAVSGRVLRMNQMAAMFLGRPIDEVIGRAPEDWFATEEARTLREDLGAALGATDGLRREMLRPTLGGRGERRAWDVRIVALAAAGDAQLLLVASDVTEQRAAEQARLEAAISQREMLIKEVHHRIKNNLQGVAGLLQQTATRRPELAPQLAEAVGQVQAIAQVHGLQVGAAGPLRVRPVMEAIAASVQRTFGRPIHVKVQGEAVHRFALPEAESIPIALTLNELLTNAIKHSSGGEVRVTVDCNEARVAIVIANAGKLREGFSLARVAPGVSGLGLVRALLPRRHASFSLQEDGDDVVARIELVPPGVTVLAPL